MTVQKATEEGGGDGGLDGGGERHSSEWSPKQQPAFIKASSFSLLFKQNLDLLHLNIFYNASAKDSLVHVFILFLQGIWVMVGLEEAEVFTTQQDSERELMKA